MWYYLLSSRNVWSIKPHRKPLFSFKKEKEKKEGYVYAGNLRFFRKNNYKIIYCLKRKLSSDITSKDLQVEKKKGIVLSSMMESYDDKKKLMGFIGEDK